MAATGRQLKQSVKVFHSLMLYLRLPENKNNKLLSRIASKPINIWWIRTGSHPYEKIMSRIVLYPAFEEN